MAITYEVSTDPGDDEWRVRGLLHVYGHEGRWCVFAIVDPGRQFDILELRILPIEHIVTRPDPDAPHGFVEVPVPTEQNTHGEWSGEPALVRRGGIPSRLLRSLRESDIHEAAREWMVEHGAAEGWRDHQWQAAAQALVDDEARRRTLKPDQRLALVAARYADLVGAGERRPNDVLAGEFDRTPEWAAQEVYRARQRELLEPRKPGRGQVIGTLTDKAIDILNELDTEGTP